jgi:hypothetical protein
MKFRIRYNKSAGEPGRGTTDHKWRVFDETGKEWICKSVWLLTTSHTEADPNGHDWNLVTKGVMHINRADSTITITEV